MNPITAPASVLDAISILSVWLGRRISQTHRDTVFWANDEGDTIMSLSWEEPKPVVTVWVDTFPSQPSDMVAFAIIGYCGGQFEYREVSN